MDKLSKILIAYALTLIAFVWAWDEYKFLTWESYGTVHLGDCDNDCTFKGIISHESKTLYKVVEEDGRTTLFPLTAPHSIHFESKKLEAAKKLMEKNT